MIGDNKMKKLLLILSLVGLMFLVGCTEQPQITNFEECVAAGNPAMESYPRQCRDPVTDTTFTEEIENTDIGEIEKSHVCSEEEKAANICTMEYVPVCGDNGVTYGNGCGACSSKVVDSYVEGECMTEELMTEEDAREIALESQCVDGATLAETGSYNENSETWWFDINMDEPREGCSPACVVYKQSKAVEINWRCTGLVE